MNTAAIQHIDEVLAVAESQSRAATDDVVRNSWLRSANAHSIDPASDQAPLLLTAREIQDVREPVTRFLEIAQPELDHLYKLVRPTHYAVLLCDNNGVVIDHRGDEAEAQQFRYWGTWLGGVWAEDVEGTNGIGTCIAERQAVTVHRSQHFRARHIDLSCSGAPVFDPRGEFAGVLDVSSIDPTISEHAHALTGSLTIAAARAIEERLFREEFRRDWILVVRVPDHLGSSMMLAVDRDRRIVGAGRIGRAVLAHLGHRFDKGLDLSTVFERSDGLFRKKDGGDVWTHVRPVGTEEAWLAIVTPPEPVSARWRQSEIDDLRPRLDMLLTGPWPRQVESRIRGGLTPAMMRRVHDYIDGHLNQNIDLESLAKAAGLSMFHFARAFKQSEGTTPHDYVLARRIAKARELLLQPGLALSEIAFAVGFADQSHFTRRFREAVGVSPGRFRRLQK